MQAYQGYYDAGRFQTLDGNPVMERGNAILLFIKGISQAEEPNDQLEAFDEFMAAVRVSGEEPPEFVRANLAREIDL